MPSNAASTSRLVTPHGLRRPSNAAPPPAPADEEPLSPPSTPTPREQKQAPLSLRNACPAALHHQVDLDALAALAF